MTKSGLPCKQGIRSECLFIRLFLQYFNQFFSGPDADSVWKYPDLQSLRGFSGSIPVPSSDQI